MTNNVWVIRAAFGERKIESYGGEVQQKTDARKN